MQSKLSRILGVVGAFALVAAFSWAASHASVGFQNSEVAFHSVVPLGVESLQFSKSKQLLNLMASAYSPEFDGFHRASDSKRSSLISGSETTKFYPTQITFRISAL